MAMPITSKSAVCIYVPKSKGSELPILRQKLSELGRSEVCLWSPCCHREIIGSGVALMPSPQVTEQVVA
jgi:hypothetical protein